MEPNTVFAKFPPEDLPDDDTSAAMQDLVETELATAGLARYECPPTPGRARVAVIT